MSTPSIQTLITQAQQVLNLKSSNEIRATLAAVLANANVGTPLNPNLTTQQLWDEFYEIVRQPSDDIMSIITDQMMRMVFSPPAPGGAGADKQVIFNDMGVLAGDAGLVYNKTTDALTVAGLVTAGSATITGALTVDTTTLVVNAAGYADRVGIGTATPAHTLQVQAAAGNIVSFTDGTTPGSLYSGGGYAGFTIPAANNGFFINPAGNFATISTNGVENVRVESAGNLKVNYGNLIIGTSGKGIDFSAVTGGTGTATGNVLNDYEEGTWTPTVTAETGTIGATVVNSANYTKIGRLVNVTFDITITSAGTGTGGLKLSLPFSCVAGSTAGATREYQTTGYMGQVFRFDATNVLVYNYINTTVISAGNKVMGGYTYFAS